MSQPEESSPPWNQTEEALRARTEPELAEIQRISRRVLAVRRADSPRGKAGDWKWAVLAAAAVCLAVLGTLLLYRPHMPNVPSPTQQTQPPLAYQLVNSGGVVAVTTRSGQIQAIVAGGDS